MTKQNVHIFGRIPSFQTTKQRLNSEKWHVELGH